VGERVKRSSGIGSGLLVGASGSSLLLGTNGSGLLAVVGGLLIAGLISVPILLALGIGVMTTSRQRRLAKAALTSSVANNTGGQECSNKGCGLRLNLLGLQRCASCVHVPLAQITFSLIDALGILPLALGRSKTTKLVPSAPFLRLLEKDPKARIHCAAGARQRLAALCLRYALPTIVSGQAVSSTPHVTARLHVTAARARRLQTYSLRG
jgi:hypothetical protein